MLQRQKLVARTFLIKWILVKVSMKSWRIFSQAQTQNLNLRQEIMNLSVFLETTYWKYLMLIMFVVIPRMPQKWKNTRKNELKG